MKLRVRIGGVEHANGRDRVLGTSWSILSAHDKPRAAIRRPARGEAWNFVVALLASPGLAVLVPTERLADIAEALIGAASSGDRQRRQHSFATTSRDGCGRYS
jgi:hypothetical protein